MQLQIVHAFICIFSFISVLGGSELTCESMRVLRTFQGIQIEANLFKKYFFTKQTIDTSCFHRDHRQRTIIVNISVYNRVLFGHISASLAVVTTIDVCTVQQEKSEEIDGPRGFRKT